MNQLFYNDTLLPESDLKLSATNRAFAYADGVFETMIANKGHLLYAESHWERLISGLSKMGIELPTSLNLELLKEKIILLTQKNKLHEQARIKLTVWRKEGGLINPEYTLGEYLLMAVPYFKPIEVKTSAGIATDVILFPNYLSRYKTLNFQPYIAAAIEKKKKKLDEIFLTDYKGNLAEASSSNLFWCKEDVVYTPSLESGCIEGIMRKEIIAYCKKEGLKVVEGLFTPTVLNDAELIFTSNVGGLSLVESFADKKINTQYTLYQAIKLNLNLI